MLSDILPLLSGAILVNNLVLTQLLGAELLIGTASKVETAIVMGIVTTLTVTLSSICTWLAWHWVLVPLDLTFLRTVVYVLIIMVVMKLTVMALHKHAPALHSAVKTSPPLLTINSAVLGVALINIDKAYSLWEAAVYGFGAAVGLSLVFVLFSALRERLAFADVPQPFQGSAIVLITAGLMSLAFMGFAGLV